MRDERFAFSIREGEETPDKLIEKIKELAKHGLVSFRYYREVEFAGHKWFELLDINETRKADAVEVKITNMKRPSLHWKVVVRYEYYEKHLYENI